MACHAVDADQDILPVATEFNQNSTPLSLARRAFSACRSSTDAIQIDLGSPMLVSRVMVLNRGDCCQNRIVGFRLGLFAGPGGTMPVGAPQVFSSTKTLYTFNFPGCIAGPPSTPSASGGAGSSGGSVVVVAVVVIVVAVGLFVGYRVFKKGKSQKYVFGLFYPFAIAQK
jgi:hypothetical protein